jgi:uncharacterized membrane protein YdbT with pleckstrin-like domain
MSYVNKVLQPGETLLFRGKLHWMVYVPAVVFAAVGIAGAVLAANHQDNTGYQVLAAAGLGLALIAFLRGWMKRWTTEIAVTDRRVIVKHGFISRQTVEMHMDKVESVDVSQSILGRIFDYGDILIRGTGAGLEPLHNIQSPLALRNAVTAR